MAPMSTAVETEKPFDLQSQSLAFESASAEDIQVGDGMECPFPPVRDEAAKTMPEEKVNAGFGVTSQAVEA